MLDIDTGLGGDPLIRGKGEQQEKQRGRNSKDPLLCIKCDRAAETSSDDDSALHGCHSCHPRSV